MSILSRRPLRNAVVAALLGLLLAGSSANARTSEDLALACPTKIEFVAEITFPIRKLTLELSAKWVEGLVEPDIDASWVEWAKFYQALMRGRSELFWDFRDIMARTIRTCYLVKEGGFTYDEAYTLLEVFRVRWHKTNDGLEY